MLNNMGGRCQINRLIDAAAKTVESHGYCAYTDADNDQIFEKCDFLPGKPNTCELTGGTGKFQGLQASIIITSAPVKSTYEGKTFPRINGSRRRNFPEATAGRRVLHHQRRDRALATLAVGHFWSRLLSR